MKKKIFYLKKNFIWYLFTLVLAFILIKPILDKTLQLKAKYPLEVGKTGLDDPTTNSNRLIVDSILSIIQHYYVDEYKVSNISLLKNGLQKLADKKEFSLSVGKDFWNLTSIDGRKISINIPSSYEYYELLADVMEINYFTDTYYRNNNENYTPNSYLFLNHILQSLDRHSTLLESENYRSLRQGTEGSFGGLGVVVGLSENLLKIIKPIENSPAHDAGLEAGDIIVGINDFLTYGSSLEQIVEKMRGSPGTRVNLVVLKNIGNKIERIDLERKIVKVDSVSDEIYELENHSILSLKIDTFSAHTADEIKEILKKYQNSVPKKISGIILDLRANPGGLLDQAIEVSDIFLKNGSIIFTEGRKKEFESAKIGYVENGLPVVVLLNSQSASASEIVAGALKDNNRAIIVGEPSFGKGTVQTIFELPRDQALKLTIARYLTPSKHSIQDKGVMPNLWLLPIQNANKGKNLLSLERLKSKPYSVYKNNYSDYFKKHDSTERYFVPPSLEFDNETIDPAEYSAMYLLRELSDNMEKGQDYTEKYRNKSWYQKAKIHLTDFLKNQEGKMIHQLLVDSNIDWQVNQSTGNSKDCDLNKVSIALKSDKKLKLPNSDGNNILIKYKITNKCSLDLNRISLFIESNYDELDIPEYLIGKISAESEFTNKVEIPINLTKVKDDLQLRAKIVINGILSHVESEKSSIKIEPEQNAKFEYAIELEKNENDLVDSEHLSTLKIKMTNKSNFKINNLEAELINLSGDQMVLGTSIDRISELDNMDHKVFNFTVKKNRLVTNTDLYFGLKIKYKDSIVPITKCLKIDRFPAEKVSIMR